MGSHEKRENIVESSLEYTQNNHNHKTGFITVFRRWKHLWIVHIQKEFFRCFCTFFCVLLVSIWNNFRCSLKTLFLHFRLLNKLHFVIHRLDRIISSSTFFSLDCTPSVCICVCVFFSSFFREVKCLIRIAIVKHSYSHLCGKHWQFSLNVKCLQMFLTSFYQLLRLNSVGCVANESKNL